MAEIYESQINDEKGKLLAYKKFTSASWVIVDQKRVIECLIYYIKNREMYQATAACTNTKSGILPDTDIPGRPNFASPTTLNFASNADGVISAGDVSGNTDFLFNGVNWNSETVFLSGISGKRFSNADVNTILGSTLGTNKHCLVTSGTVDNVEMYGKSATEPLRLEKSGDASGNGGSGLAWFGTAVGNTQVFQNMIIKNVGFASVVMNSSGVLSGGDVNTPPVSTVNYLSTTMRYLRSSGNDQEGEGRYFGNTSKSAFAIHQYINEEHSFITAKGRDGVQVNNCKDYQGNKITVYNIGVTNTGSQNKAIQSQNSKTYIRNSIFDRVPGICDISGWDVLVEDCYFNQIEDVDNIIHDYTNVADYADGTRLTVTPVRLKFNRCIFRCEVTRNSLFRVYERVCNYEVSNSIIDTRYTNMYQDSRGGGPSNSLIGGLSTNGNVNLATAAIDAIGKPVYMSTNIDDYTTHGRNTNLYIKLRGMGFRNPY